MKQTQRGFTLVEIAIVLVIVGLILGGVLKGQEMISNAKVRNIVDQTTAVQTATLAFQDRYRALPGDYSAATTNISGVAGNGTGDGFIATNNERGYFWQHLGNAGFITGSFDGAAVANNNLTCAATSCPTNAFGGAIKYSWGATAAGSTTNAHELRIGSNIPVNVLAEIDRKIDDGIPETGTFRADSQINLATCRTGAGSTSTYNVTAGQTNCAGVRVN